MDETSCKFVPPVQKGIVMARGRQFKDLVRRGQGGSLRARRSAVSYVAFVCDQDRVQAKLPQIVVSNEHVLTQRQFAAIRCLGGSRIRVLRRISSWNNASLMVEIVGILAGCLEEERRTHHIIFTLDAHKSHLSPRVVRACAAAGFHIMYIPAATTGWLQPLDLIVFRQFKAVVCREVERQRLASADGVLTNVDIMATYIRAIDSVVVRGSWRRAFKLAGLGGQSEVSERLKRRLEWQDVPGISDAVPELAELQMVYPRHYTIPIDDIFEVPLASTRPQPLVLRAAARLPPAPMAERHW